MNYSDNTDKRTSKLRIDHNVIEIDIDLSRPRLIPIKGKDNKGKEIIWHLKVTEKGRLVLL
ncbi:MAG: hypothetical protein AB1552_10900 [Nitrospirota bacterium]